MPYSSSPLSVSLLIRLIAHSNQKWRSSSQAASRSVQPALRVASYIAPYNYESTRRKFAWVNVHERAGESERKQGREKGRGCRKVKYLSQGDELNHVNRTLHTQAHAKTHTHTRVARSRCCPERLSRATRRWNFVPLQTRADIFREAEIAREVLERGVLGCHWKFTIFPLSI